MSKFHIALAVATILTGVPALSEERLRIVADIGPVQSLASMVAGDLADLSVIVRPGASPHGYSMRPSEARALEEADIVVWIGEGLTSWMADAISTISEHATVLELLEVEGTLQLPSRSGATFASGHSGHDDGHAHGEHEEAAETDHDHGHDEHADEESADTHGSDHAGHDDHDHGAFDPHGWLSPENAKVWLAAIGDAISQGRPDSAGDVATRVADGTAAIDAAVSEAREMLAPVADKPFVVYHDAFQYFEESFGVAAQGALALSDATPPSAARIANIRDLVAEAGIVCAFAEPQFDPGLVETVFGQDAEVRVAVLDPLGSTLDAGPEAYPTLIRTMSAAIADCLS